jgi:hypothetical protein
MDQKKITRILSYALCFLGSRTARVSYCEISKALMELSSCQSDM